MTNKYDVISPDGFAIENNGGYESAEAARAAFNIWKTRFERQGYYSSNNGRIALEDLESCCEFTTPN